MDNQETLSAADVKKPPAEKLLVCVSPSPTAVNLINSAKRMAANLNAKWFAAYVETTNALTLTEAERDNVADNLHLADQLGAETIVLNGTDIAKAIINFAREKNITTIIAGKPRRSHWKSIVMKSPVDKLVRISGQIDIYIITGETEEQREASYVIRPPNISLSDYISGLLFFILANAFCFLMYPHYDLSNINMVYLLGILLIAVNCGRGPAILFSFLSVLTFDFFFVPPRFSFTVEEAQSIVTFVVMLLVSLVISQLTTQMRQQTEVAHLQARQASAMHGLCRRLVSVRGIHNILQLAIEYISEIFDCQVVALLPDKQGKLRLAAGDPSTVFEKDIVKEINFAHSAYDTGKMVGWGLQSDSITNILYLPLQAVDTALGVFALRPSDPYRFLLREQLHLLESLAKQVSLALEVERLNANEI